MHCHICQAEAVARCYNCGELICARHGDEYCTNCTTGIAAGDPRPDRISTAPLARGQRPGWWRPQPAEEYTPPACYDCRGLARAVCYHCGERYCPEHAGPRGLCRACGRSSWLGPIFLALSFAMMAALILWGWCQGY